VLSLIAAAPFFRLPIIPSFFLQAPSKRMA